MPVWNEELQQWGYLYFEEVPHFIWLGIERKKMDYIDKPFAYHKPSPDGMKRINALRQAYSVLMQVIETECHDSRHKAVAKTELETSAMWAIKAVVFNDPDSVAGD